MQDWEAAGLLAPSFVKLNKLATLKVSLIERKLGKMSEADMELVREKLKGLFGVSEP